MAKLVVTLLDESVREVDGQPGWTVMEIIREAGVDDLLALCGGCCSCATCHVYVDPQFAELMPPMSDDENELLDTSSFRTPESRLSCQIVFKKEMEGLKVKIAPES